MGLVHDLDEYLGRNMFWRVLFLSLSTAVVLIFFIIFAISMAALGAIIFARAYPTVGAIVDFMNRILTINLPLIVGSAFFGPWLCSLLISVSSHPVNQPQHFRWMIVGSFVIILLIVIWVHWMAFIPLLMYSPTLPYDFVPFTMNIIAFMVLNLFLCILVILASINVWLRWLTR